MYQSKKENHRTRNELRAPLFISIYKRRGWESSKKKKVYIYIYIFRSRKSSSSLRRSSLFFFLFPLQFFCWALLCFLFLSYFIFVFFSCWLLSSFFLLLLPKKKSYQAVFFFFLSCIRWEEQINKLLIHLPLLPRLPWPVIKLSTSTYPSFSLSSLYKYK